MKNLTILFIIVILFTGCNITYRGPVNYPVSKIGLQAMIVDREARLEDLELEMKDHKESRDKMIEALEKTDGWLAKDSMINYIKKLDMEISFTRTHISWIKSDIVGAKEKLKVLEVSE